MDNMRTIGLPSDIIAKCQIDIGILLHGICKARGMTQGGATSLGLGKAKSVEFRTLAWKNPCSWPIKLHCNLGNSSQAFQNTKTHLNLVKLTEWSNFYPGNQLETHGFWTPIDAALRMLRQKLLQRGLAQLVQLPQLGEQELPPTGDKK